MKLIYRDFEILYVDYILINLKYMNLYPCLVYKTDINTSNKNNKTIFPLCQSI